MDEKVETQAEDNNATRKVSFRPQPGIVEAFFPPSHGIQYEPTFITSNLRPSIFGKLNGGMRVTNYSVQTGEEFALQFAQQASRAQRGSEMEQVSLQKFNAHEASPYVYEDLTGILGIGRVDSGTHSEISMLAPEKGNLSDFGSYCNPTYTESLQGVQIPCSGNDGGYQMDEGVFAPSAWQTRSQHTPYSSTQRSHLSGRSNDSSRGKVKFMCSFGGKILPRPSDGKLRYVGGETRIITVNKDIGYEELMQKTMDFYSQALILKYQLPGEDLDALVSVSSDEDLENMMEEYDKLENSNGSSRLRIFLFTAGDNDLAHFDAIADKRYSEQQYVDAINGIPDTSVRKHSESLGSFSSHHLDNLIGLDVAENWNTNRRAPEGLDPLQPQFSKDGTKIVNLPNVRPSSSKAVVSGADFPSLLSAPFSSLPMHVEQSVVADSPIHFHPEQINSHSYSVARPAEGYHDIDSGRSFPSSALFQHEVQYKHTESRMSLNSPTNHQNDFLLPSHSDFMFKGGGRLADTNVVQPILNPKSDGLHPVDLQRIAQVPPSGHQAVWHPHFDKEHYAYTTIDFIPQVISPGLHLQQPVQHTMQKIPLNVLQTANHDTAVSRYTDRVHISHDDILEGPRDSILRNEHHLDVLKEVGSSPPSPSHGGGGKLNAQVQQTHNVPHLDEEDSGPRVPLDNNRFDGVFCPSASPDSSGQFYEEAVYEQNSHHDKSYSEEQFTHHETLSHEQVISSDERFIRPQALPHVLSDTVLSKSVHPISEGISVSQGHHSDSLLAAIPLYVGSSKSEEQSISFQDHEGMGDAQSRIIHQSEQIPAVSSGWQQSKVTHVSGESLKDESDNDIKQKSLEKDDKMHAIMRTSLDQSECSDRKQIAQLSERTYAKSAVSHGRIGSSDGMDTTVTLGLGDSYQAYQKPDNADTLGEASYQLKVPTSGGPIGATGIATEATQVPHLSGRINHMALPGSGPNAQEGGIESHVPSSTSGIWVGEMTVERDHTKVEAPRYAHEPTGNLLDDSTVNNDMISPQYLPGQFLEKSLIDEDYVNSANQLSAINKFLDDLATHVPATTVDPFNHDISKGLFQQPAGNKAGRNQMESSSTRELSAHLDAVAVGLAHVNLHELENKGESHNVSQDMAACVDLNFPPALVSEWGPVSEDVRVDENISLGKVAEVVDEETITTQDSDNDEAKLDDSDKDELSDSALAEMEAIAHGLQIIKNADLEELRELGSGTFGTVYHGKWRGTDVAIKRIKNSCFTGRPSEQERMRVDFWREAWMLANLHHPNVVAFYGVVPDGPGGTLATVTEYMVNGSLKQVLQRKDRTIDRKRRLLIAMDAAFGMEYLHGKNIVHFDLKCENLLVNMRDPQRPICKVGDLGLSKIKHQTLVSGGVRGTLPWMAPELLNGSSSMVSEKVDVFSFGIVMWELLTGEEPYANMHYGAIIGGIVNNTLRPHVPNWCDPSWRALMEQCWSPDPAARPTFSEIANRLRSMAMSIHSKGHGHHPHVHHGLS